MSNTEPATPATTEAPAAKRPHAFDDAEGRSWALFITVADIKRVRIALNLDLLSIDDGVLFDELATNPILLVDLLWVLLEPQAKERGISDEQFGAALGGEAIDHATTALLNALVDFFPSRRRTMLQHQLRKLREYESKLLATAAGKMDSERMTNALEQKLKQLEREMDEGIDREISGGSSTNSPAS